MTCYTEKENFDSEKLADLLNKIEHAVNRFYVRADLFRTGNRKSAGKESRKIVGEITKLLKEWRKISIESEK